MMLPVFMCEFALFKFVKMWPELKGKVEACEKEEKELWIYVSEREIFVAAKIRV